MISAVSTIRTMWGWFLDLAVSMEEFVHSERAGLLLSLCDGIYTHSYLIRPIPGIH